MDEHEFHSCANDAVFVHACELLRTVALCNQLLCRYLGGWNLDGTLDTPN